MSTVRSLGEIAQILERSNAGKPDDERRASRFEQTCAVFNDGFFCTRPMDHRGDHVAHGMFNSIRMRWKDGNT